MAFQKGSTNLAATEMHEGNCFPEVLLIWGAVQPRLPSQAPCSLHGTVMPFCVSLDL